MSSSLDALLVPSPALAAAEEDGVLLEDSFFGVKADLVVNPPGVVFAADVEYDLFTGSEAQEPQQQQTTFNSPGVPSTNLSYSLSGSNFGDFSDSSYSYSSVPTAGWQEENQDLWFLENFTGAETEVGRGGASPSKEEILEEIRMEVTDMLAPPAAVPTPPLSPFSSNASSPALEEEVVTEPTEVTPTVEIRPQETIFIDGQPVLSIPAGEVPADLLKAGPEVFLELRKNALGGLELANPQPSHSGLKVRYNQSPGKKRGRWRSSGIADPKERKKAQNREAAARYRLKKQQEKEGIQGELDAEEQRNRGLRTRIQDMEHEIKYLKGLMQEIRAKHSA